MNDVFCAAQVSYLHTEAEVDSVIAEEGTSGRLVILEVGFTFCKPCKRFEPVFKEYARRFPEARFIRVNGNENADMARGRAGGRLRLLLLAFLRCFSGAVCV